MARKEGGQRARYTGVIAVIAHLLAFDGDSGKRQERATRLPALSTHQIVLLQLLAKGRSTRLMAAETGGSPNTVQYHFRSIFNVLGINNRQEALNVAEALRLLGGT